MKIRRIVHVGKYYPPHVGGTEMYSWQLASHQAKRARVTVLAANDRRRTQRELVDGVDVVRMATFGVVSSMPITPSLPLQMARVSADIVHMHVPNPSAAAAAFLSHIKGQLILTHHADTLSHHAETRGRPLYKWMSDP